MTDNDMKSYAKEIIDVANRYEVVNLKLEAEACLIISFHDLFTPTLIRDVFAAVARGKTTSGTDGNGGKCRFNSCESVNCVGRLMRRG